MSTEADCGKDWEALTASVLSLTREMLLLARAGDWDHALEREAQRRPLFDALFAQPLPAAIASQIEAHIREILADDAAVLALIEQGRREIRESLQDLSQGRKARLAYTAHEG